MQLQVARIGKPHGIRGEVTVQVLTDTPQERFSPGTVIEVLPASLGPLTVTSSRWNKDILLLGFENIEDRNSAETLRGAELFIEAATSDDDGEGWYEHELTGLSARVGEDIIGTVTALRTGDVQDLLVVKGIDGTEILVPFVEAIVPVVDPEAGYILLTPPAGLLGVNAGDPEEATDPEAATEPEN